ncbi:MAG: MmgE/PrpD family protein [Hyphomicrobiaceae bacterium]
MQPLTTAIAEFVATFDPATIPERCEYGARIGMIDCLGVMIAGAGEEAVRLVAATVADSTTDGAPEIPTGRNLAPADAALVNGVAAHALDYDDVGMDGHPSAVLTPAILAEGWSLGTSGQDAIAAYIAGYEVWALLQELEPGSMHERGFHPTAIWGALACAAACARLNRLNPEQTGHAIAIGASLAAGLVANFGTMTKPLHVGRTAQAGVFAARLAKAGFTGSRDVLEHAAGFMQAHSRSGRPDIEPRDWQLGSRWRMQELGINIKRYPMCYATHRSIDAMLDLAGSHDLNPNAVSRIDVRIGTTQSLMLRNHEPKTGLEAKFSMEFAMASALIERKVGLQELTDDFVGREDVGETMRKVRISTTEEKMADMPFSPDDRVSVRLVSGETLAADPVVRPKGSWQRPLDEKELREKFLDCAATCFDRSHAENLFSHLSGIKAVKAVRQLPLCR